MFKQWMSFILAAWSLVTVAVADDLSARAIDRAHAEIWRRFVDEHGIVRDFVGDLPTPEDCTLGRPNAIGWWSPIENGPMFTGMYLNAMCERFRRSGLSSDREEARRLAQGLLKCASVSEVPGFVARGVGSDGKCHYPLSSDDQMHPWFLGLHTYFKSDIPTEQERGMIAAKVREVAEVLEAAGWQVPCDGAFAGQYRGGFKGELFRDAVRYLYILHATHEITGDASWLERYRKALKERPDKSLQTRLEICAEGYPRDREAIKNIDKFQLWIYVGSQAALAKLAMAESESFVKEAYCEGLTVNAQNALPAVGTHVNFDNADQKVFGNANWREVYSTWFPQATQAEAQRLSEISDSNKKGARKSYEALWVRNPLAGAVIVAFGAKALGREEILKAIRHYDYSRLNMAEFFFAECAYYALPVMK